MNRQPTSKAFGVTVIALLGTMLLLVLGLQAVASAATKPSSDFLGRHYTYSYITAQTQSGHSTSGGQDVLVSTRDSLLVFAISRTDGTTSYEAIPSHPLVSMHTTDK